MKYFGEQESQAESNAALAANMPLTFFLMFVTLLFLFKTYRKPIVILLMLPLIFIGIVLGLLLLGKTFRLLRYLGITGADWMNIKNAIVLVDQIDAETAWGKRRAKRYQCNDHPHCPRSHGIGNNHSGHAAIAVRCHVRRYGRHYHGRSACSFDTHPVRIAGGLLCNTQDKGIREFAI